MSYLHIGQNAMLPEKRIIGIFDLDITSQSKRTREFLEKAEQEGGGGAGDGGHPQVLFGVRPPVSQADRVYFAVEYPDPAEAEQGRVGEPGGPM